MEYQTCILSNGVRIIHVLDNSPVAYCGLVVNAGTRDEEESEHGMAHYIEHMLFKGTQKRRANHILNRLETVGGELNAYTAKEETFVYAVTLTEDMERAVELISDVVFHATFPQNELERETDVILEEIQLYKDTPSELIFDDFDEIVFANHPMGHQILGDIKQLRKYKKADAERFIAAHYHTDEMVFFSVGNVDFKKVVRWAKKYIEQNSENLVSQKRMPLSAYVPQQITKKKKTHQIHLLTGNRAYDIQSPNRIAMALLNNLLGGPGLNSLLNIALREKNGLVYNVESNYFPYTDTGIFSVYVGCDPKNKERCEELIKKILRQLRETPLSESKLSAFKKQIIGQTAISSENKENLALSIGKAFLHTNKIESNDEWKKQLMNVSARDLQNIANEIFDHKQISSLLYY